MNNILIMRSVANVEQNHTYIKINLLKLNSLCKYVR